MTRRQKQQTLAPPGTVDGDQVPAIHRGRPVRKHYLQIVARIYITSQEAEAYLATEDPADLTITGRVVKEIHHLVKGKVTPENADGIYYDHQLTWHGTTSGDDEPADASEPADPEDDEPPA